MMVEQKKSAPESGAGEEEKMGVIKFDPRELERIEAFLEEAPDPDELERQELERCRLQTQQMIDALNALEPRSEKSEAYDHWAELHEDLEDLLDEILDCLEM